MKKIYSFRLLLAVLFSSFTLQLMAQGSESYGTGIKIPLDTSGQKFIRFINWHQFWMRSAQYNPGSTINGEAQEGGIDFAIRRSRFLFYTQMNSRFMILTHIGINNQTLVGGGGLGQAANIGNTSPDGKKPQIFIHEATAEFHVLKKKLTLGGGLHYWNGVSRMANASTLNFMTLDAPIFNWANIDASDQFARMMGWYAKGKFGKFDYRLAFNVPFAIPASNALARLDTTAAKNNIVNASYRGIGGAKPAYQGYFMYQFWDQESNLLPYTVGSYVGTKKVFNIGAGFFHNADAMWAAKSNGTRWDTVRQNCFIWAVDAFLDKPLNKTKGTAITAYLSYNKHYMGDNYVRNIGISNPANGLAKTGTTFSGAGNAFPTVGTGDIFYAQAGYVFPKTKIGKFQLMGDVTYANYERVTNAVVIPDVGLNYYLEGHNAKLTLNYRSRPVVDYVDPTKTFGDLETTERKGEVVLQLQIYL